MKLLPYNIKKLYKRLQLSPRVVLEAQGCAVKLISESRLTFYLLSSSIQVSEELIRVAILWHEMWHEGLEEASRLYFGERNVKGMFAVLEPLHAMMERGPQTLKETSFNQVCFTQCAV